MSWPRVSLVSTALGSEVWFWRKSQISVHVLVGETYEARTASTVLPGIDLKLLAELVPVRPVSKALRTLRDRLPTG